MKQQIGILFDANLCVGCGSCYDACKLQNELHETNKDFLKDHLSNNTYTVVEQYNNIFARKMCMHCSEPTCVSVCPVSAFEKTELGPVLYNPDKCIGCRYARLKEGKIMACAEACPTGATQAGVLSKLIAEAKRRLREKPDKYYQEIYGLNEAGGGNVLIISPVPFDQLGYNTKIPKQPMSGFTLQAMEKIPSVVSVGGIFLTGMYWLTKRKNEIAKEKRIMIRGEKNEN
jgi:formate dehydrogenase iron-sulfur subunit